MENTDFNAPLENTNFNTLLEKYARNQLSEAETAKFKAWLDVMRRQNIDRHDLTAEEEEILFQKITSKIDRIQEVVAFGEGKGNARSLMSSTWVRIAATLLIVVVASFAIWKAVGTPSTGQEIVAGNDGEKIILDDGTIVWLHKDSRLTYHLESEGDVRNVVLKGEALFEVAKDPNHPFSIECGDITVKVLGTSFSLKTGEENIELTVLTGKVNLSSVEDKVGIDVSPNEKAIYTDDGMIEKIPLEKTEVESIIANTEYNMNFDDSSLESIFSKLEKKFDITIKIGGGEFSKCRVTTDLSDQSLELSLQSLNELVKFDYKINNKSVVISGQGCN